MQQLLNVLNSLNRKVKKLIFKTIYKTYLWSASHSAESFLGVRSVEYPFVIEELRENLISSTGKILLVGCAGDPLCTILPALGYETVGLDKKYVAIKYTKFCFVRDDIRKTAFPDEYFDAVVAVSTIEHVGVLESDYDGDKKAMREISRVLKPEGLAIITVPIAPKSKIMKFERKYDLKSLRMLFKDFTIKNQKLFKKDKDGYWVPCSSEELPCDEEAVCLTAMKRA
jgi:SAM-dependent methyltransferase